MVPSGRKTGSLHAINVKFICGGKLCLGKADQENEGDQFQDYGKLTLCAFNGQPTKDHIYF